MKPLTKKDTDVKLYNKRILLGTMIHLPQKQSKGGGFFGTFWPFILIYMIQQWDLNVSKVVGTIPRQPRLIERVGGRLVQLFERTLQAKRRYNMVIYRNDNDVDNAREDIMNR